MEGTVRKILETSENGTYAWIEKSEESLHDYTVRGVVSFFVSDLVEAHDEDEAREIFMHEYSTIGCPPEWGEISVEKD